MGARRSRHHPPPRQRAPVHDLGTPELEQAIATRLVPRLDEIARQRGELLRAGRDALRSALIDAFPEWDVPRVSGGVSMWVGIGEPLSTPLVMNARSRGLALSAGSRFAVEGGHDRRLRVPFTAPPATLERAVGILRAAWDDVRGGRTVPRGRTSPRSSEPVAVALGRGSPGCGCVLRTSMRPRVGCRRVGAPGCRGVAVPSVAVPWSPCRCALASMHPVVSAHPRRCLRRP